MRPLRLLTGLALTLLLAGPVKAQVTYTYVGHSFDTFSTTFPDGTNPFTSANFVSGSFTVDSVLADGVYNFMETSLTANSINFAMTFTDGYNRPWSYSNTPEFCCFEVGMVLGSPRQFDIVVAGGNITSWAVLITGPNVLVQPPEEDVFGAGSGFLSSSGGSLAGVGVAAGDHTDYGEGWFYAGPIGYATGGASEFGRWTSPVAPIPEPETYAMLLAGLALVGFATRKRQRMTAAA